MAEGGDFYSHDRPDSPRLEEDRPRGGGPEEPRARGSKHIWLMILAVLVLLVILTVIFG
ncbi:hypothetical protein [Streptomyces sp. NPDC047028]|uniref:hypothetical protein n=1 Tax=Streptomyces sp. NPDC047028 TaxID=3155793 RepID=UPI0033EC9DFF